MKKYDRLVSRVEITRECRYHAEKRLGRRNHKAYYLISMLSLFVIVISVLPNVHEFDEVGIQWLLLLTIINSVFIIVTTLVDAGGDYALKEFHMRISARKLDNILNKLILAKDEEKCDEVWLRQMYQDYQSTLHDCPIDHIPVDYTAVQVNQPHLFETRWKDHSKAQLRLMTIIRPVHLYYRRGRWMLPHVTIFIFTFVLIVDMWNPQEAFLGVPIFTSEPLD